MDGRSEMRHEAAIFETYKLEMAQVEKSDLQPRAFNSRCCGGSPSHGVLCTTKYICIVIWIQFSSVEKCHLSALRASGEVTRSLRACCRKPCTP
jgi:hypothetical protein